MKQRNKDLAILVAVILVAAASVTGPAVADRDGGRVELDLVGTYETTHPPSMTPERPLQNMTCGQRFPHR